MRICFELLELLKAHKKAIRRATVNTFGYIAKAIGYVGLMLIHFYTQLPNIVMIVSFLVRNIQTSLHINILDMWTWFY